MEKCPRPKVPVSVVVAPYDGVVPHTKPSMVELAPPSMVMELFRTALVVVIEPVVGADTVGGMEFTVYVSGEASVNPPEFVGVRVMVPAVVGVMVKV